MSATVLFCILKYQVSFNPPRWHSVCDMNGRDNSVWGRTKIFRHQSHIRGAGEAQTEGTGSRGLISELRYLRWDLGECKLRRQRQKEQWWIFSVSDLCTWRKTYLWGFRIAGHGKLEQITGKSLQVLEALSSCQWIQPILRALINFQKKTECYCWLFDPLELLFQRWIIYSVPSFEALP